MLLPKRPKNSLWALLAICFNLQAVFADDIPEIRLGLQKIFGEARQEKISLGLVEEAGASAETPATLDALRWDLSLIGTFNLLNITPEQVKDFPHPRLELKIIKTQQGLAANVLLKTPAETLGSQNIAKIVNARRLGHKIAGFVLQTLTGEKGFFLSQIAFTVRQKNKKELWIADWDGKNAKSLTNWQNICVLPAFNRQGDKLAFTSYKDGNPDLYVYDLAKKNFNLLSGYQGLNTSAAFDPLGEGLALSLSQGKTPNLYFLSPEGKILRKLTRSLGVDTSPTFSPNGQEIAFTTDRSGNPQIFIMGRDGSNLRRLTYGFFWADHADWSSGGEALVFSAKYKREEDFQIYVTDPLGMRFIRITDKGGNEDPSFSPDGRMIVFSSNRGGRWKIYIKGIAAPTADIAVISFVNADAVEPAWSPFGSVWE